jgi:hypothetical protein
MLMSQSYRQCYPFPCVFSRCLAGVFPPDSGKFHNHEKLVFNPHAVSKNFSYKIPE